MATAFAYARVSSKDQEKQGSSIPEQLLRIEEFAQGKGIKVLHVYQDTNSAFHDENREAFNRMVSDAVTEKPKFIIVDDSSRFARARDVSIVTKKLLRKHGVEVLFANEENVDTATTAGLWLDGIREIKNEAHSMEISYNTIRGMSGNIKSRDQETGWCYKNGGKAPYGYKAKRLDKGMNSKGKPIIKTIWELHPDKAEIVRLIIVDLYINRDMSYDRIRDYLNENNITGPSGKPWGTSTLVEMLRENRLQQYAGTAFWNKENKKTFGSRFNPRNKWVEVENAHPAIITQEELDKALFKKSKARKIAPTGRANTSSYLLTGTNLEGMPMFICKSCGGNVIGYRSSSKHWSKYVCGISRYKGMAGCSHDYKVDQTWLEQRILAEIETRYTVPERIEQIIKGVKEEIQKGCKDYYKGIDELNKQKDTLEQQLKRLLDAVKAGFDPSIIANEANEVKDQIRELEGKIKIVKNNPPNQASIDEEEIKDFFINFSKTFENATIEERRKLVRTFVRQIELDPEMKEVRVQFYPDNIVHSIGAAEGT